MEKFHEHDCDCCQFLGQEENKIGKFDYYVCKQGELNMPTVIARYGEYGDYLSGLFNPERLAKEYSEKNNTTTLEALKILSQNRSDDMLMKAAYLAIEQGYLDENFKYKSAPKHKMK